MTTDPYSASELGRAVERIELDIREIKADVKQQAAVYVTRGEYEAWRQGLDREVRDLKSATTSAQEATTAGLAALRSEISADFASLRNEMRNATPQWWVIAGLIVTGVGVLTALVIAISKGV